MDSLNSKMITAKGMSVEIKVLLEFKSLLILKMTHHKNWSVSRKLKTTQFLRQVQKLQNLYPLRMIALKTLNLKLMIEKTKLILNNSEFFPMVSRVK
jgi:hypothetical protein